MNASITVMDPYYTTAENYVAAHAAAKEADENKRAIGEALLAMWPDDGPTITTSAGKVQRIDASADKLAPDAAAAVELCSAGRLALLAFVAEHRLSDSERVSLRRIADALEVPHKVVKGRGAALRVIK